MSSQPGVCPLCNKQFPFDKLDAHANTCLDALEMDSDQKLAAELAAGGEPEELTFKFERKPFVSFTAPPVDPAEEERRLKQLLAEAEARKRRALGLPSDPQPPASGAVPPPAAAPPAARKGQVFDAAASHGWVEQVRTEIVRVAA